MIHAFKSIEILARFKKSQYANDNLKIQHFNSLDFLNLKTAYLFFSFLRFESNSTSSIYKHKTAWLGKVIHSSAGKQLSTIRTKPSGINRQYFPHKDQTKVEPSGCSPVKPACVSYLQRGAAIWEGRSGPLGVQAVAHLIWLQQDGAGINQGQSSGVKRSSCRGREDCSSRAGWTASFASSWMKAIPETEWVMRSRLLRF